MSTSLVAFAALAGQLHNVLVVGMCGTNGSAGACHPWLYDDGERMMREIGEVGDFIVDTTRDGVEFTAGGLANYDVVVFSNVGNNPFTISQQTAFKNYIYNGGGYIGWHASAATHSTWPWYTDTLVAGDIAGHGGIRPLPVYKDTNSMKDPLVQACLSGLFQDVTANDNIRMDLPDSTMADEWYNYNPDPRDNPNVKFLLWLQDGATPKPMAWCQQFSAQGNGEGRMMYINAGHMAEVGGNNWYTCSWFQQFLLNSLRWTAKVPEAGTAIDLKGCQPGKTELQRIFTGNETVHVEIYNIKGQRISNMPVKNMKELNGALSSGCHIVRLLDGTGRTLRQLTLAR